MFWIFYIYVRNLKGFLHHLYLQIMPSKLLYYIREITFSIAIT